ncbi:MAG: tetratricopeptide repeat protein [Anaerolineales bacterium]
MAGREDVYQKAMNEGHSAAWDQTWDVAVLAYQKAIDEFPDNAKALNSLALAQYQLQRYSDALKTYIRVARVSPEDAVAFERMAQIYERQGSLNEAIQSAMQAAELYLKAREPEKAIENWLRVVQLNPENLSARSRLAMIHEKTGQFRQAINEYIALASLVQNNGNPQKATELLDHAGLLDSNNAEIRQALTFVKAGRMLPKPMRPKGGTGPLRMAAVKELEAPKQRLEESSDPITEGRQKALQVLAEVLFDLSDDSSEAQARRGLQSIMKSTGQLSMQGSEQTNILLHLSQAIDAQTKNQDAAAADEIERAIECGFKHPAAHFNLGMLRANTNQAESALRALQQCLKHNDYALAARLLSGHTLRKLNRTKEAANEYLEALKIADAAVVEPDQADAILQLYEPLIEALNRDSDEKAQTKLCDNVEKMLIRVNWRQHLLKTRDGMPKPEGGQALPLAEIVIQAQSSNVIEAMNHVNQLARSNRLRSAMDEAFHALSYAPTYLPLHILIGDLLIREGRTPEAITKFTIVANSYSVRGEASQATNLLKRIIQLSPMDLAARTRLIEQLTARGQVNEAISEYMDLADIYYRLAELDMARKTFTTTLRLAQQPNANHNWNVKILQRMADIDMQRLDWRQAMRVFEQIRTLRPDDASVRQNLIELNLRLAQVPQAQAELESFISYLESNGKHQDAIPFIEKLLEEHSAQLMLQRALADELHKVGRTAEAISILDGVGDKLMESNDKASLIEVVNRILSMNPPNADEYRSLLAQLRGN